MLRIFILFLLLSNVSFAQSISSTSEAHERWIIKLSEEAYLAYQNQTSQDHRTKKISPHLHLVNYISNNPVTHSDVLQSFGDVDVLNIYPDRKLTQRDRIPDDFSFSSQWNMNQIAMPAIWDHLTGGTTANGDDIVIAILDDGFQIDHQDLSANWFLNTQEIPNNGIDDDGNGFIDDYIGYNADRGTDNHIVESHGTKVCGIIGAEGNNGLGVAGVNWNVKILPIGGIQFIGEIEQAMSYVVSMKQAYLDSNGAEGANILVTNLSAGIDGLFPDSAPDWCEFYDLAGNLGILSVSAAPNNPNNVDEVGDLPSLCESDFLITVTSTDINDVKVRESGEGRINIDLGAPGEMVFTTDIIDEYSRMTGTSAASPHVAGVAALLFSLDCIKFAELLANDPAEAASLIKQAIIQSVDRNDFLQQTVSQGRLNAYNAFLNLASWCNGKPLLPLEILDINYSNQKLSIEYETDNFNLHSVAIYDMTGQLYYSGDFQPYIFLENVVTLDLIQEQLSTGIYVVTLENDLGIVSTKLAVLE